MRKIQFRCLQRAGGAHSALIPFLCVLLLLLLLPQSQRYLIVPFSQSQPFSSSVPCPFIPLLILKEALARLLAELSRCHKLIEHGRGLEELNRWILFVPTVHDVLAGVQPNHICRGNPEEYASHERRERGPRRGDRGGAICETKLPLPVCLRLQVFGGFRLGVSGLGHG